MKPIVSAVIIVGVLLLVYVTQHQEATAPTVDQSASQTTSDEGAVTSTDETVSPVDQEGVRTEFIAIETPLPEQTVSSPITVRGEVRGTWLFEASAPITVVNWDGLIIGEGYITAEGDWMTEDFVPFSGTVEYDLASTTPYQRGTVIFQKANPSGLPEHDKAVEVPVQLEYTE